MKRFFSIVGLAVGLLGSSLLTMPVKAAEPATLGLTVSPPSFDLAANPGDVIENTVRITNQSLDTVTFEASVQDFKVDGTEGSVTVQENNPNAFSNWFRFAQTQYRLAPKDSAEVAFTIRVPKGAEPGGHFASVLFQPKVVAASSETGAKVIQRVGSLVLMKVSGNVIEDGKISKFNPKNFVGSWDEIAASDGKTKILVAKDEKLGDERAKYFFSGGPVAFDVLFKNSGNVHFKPTGNVSIYNIFGKKVDQLALDPRNVFPGGERRITVIWPKKSLWGGFYRAQVASVYGSKNTVLTAETMFWAFPAPVLIAILVILILGFLVRHRLRRALRILIEGR